MLIPFIEWMDGFDPYKSRNNRKSILLRTATFLPKGFDKDNHLLTFPISAGRKSHLFYDLEKEHFAEASNFNSKHRFNPFYFKSIDRYVHASLFCVGSIYDQPQQREFN